MNFYKALKNSFAFRSGNIYRDVLGRLPTPKPKKKPILNLTLLSMTGEHHLLMLEQCLLSIARHWVAIPELIIVSDGNIPIEAIQKRLSWWCGPLEIKQWQEFTTYHSNRERPELATYAEKDPFGKKLAAILAVAEQKRMIWCDTDIIFYNDFSKILLNTPANTPCIYTTEDWTRAYDDNLIKKGLSHLQEIPPVNTGLVLCEGNLYDSCGLKTLVAACISTCHSFTEQTILAEAVYRKGKVLWDCELIKIILKDHQSIKPTYLRSNWMARHYIRPVRHLFWRDALALRLHGN
jgi:hypothetical protein